ncbi:hypothetical protein Brsp06_03494 [Brucella sp. NBRC 13694]|uniref:hypothetical protein n=1 Tax=Brucella sp. NBRC 13694 TaxID=3075482 RepID=UPI00241E9611|nr:hypothetical protein [Brucella anthropi]
MQVHYEIAQGHIRGENGLLAYIKSNPGTPQEEAIAEWIDHKFGQFVRDNISNDFTIPQTDTNKFVIDFTYESDADTFVKLLGGYRMEA